MPVEPWIFLSYGRPEEKLAHAISSLLWSQRYETYNYRFDSVVVQDFKLKDGTYHEMLEIARFWMAILTPRSTRPDDFSPSFRRPVLDELLRMRDGGTPLIYLSNDRIMRDYSFLNPSHVLNLSECDSPRTITNKLIELIPADLRERCQTSWRINERLSGTSWDKLNRDMQIKYDTGCLPSAADLLDGVTGRVSIEQFIGPEICTLKAEVHRWFLTVKLSQCLKIVSTDRSQAMLLASRDIKEKDPRLLTETVPEKTYGPTETIESASEVIRGLVRVSDQIEILDYRGAYDIVGRIAWPRMRQVLLCAVYSLSRTMAQIEICHDIRGHISDDFTRWSHSH